MVRSQPTSPLAGSQNAATMVVKRTLEKSQIPDDMRVPAAPLEVNQLAPANAIESAPFATLHAPDAPDLSLLRSPNDEQPPIGEPPMLLLNQAIGRDRQQQAVQDAEFPVQPFLRHPVLRTPPGNVISPTTASGQPPAPDSLLAVPSPPAPGPPSPAKSKVLPDASVVGPPSPFGIALANNLPQEVVDSLEEQPPDYDPWDDALQMLIKAHKQQVGILLTENEELKAKLNAVVISSWKMGGEEDARGVKSNTGTSSELRPLHVTTQVPEYLQSSWLWTVSEQEQVKNELKSDGTRFKLSPGWDVAQGFGDGSFELGSFELGSFELGKRLTKGASFFGDDGGGSASAASISRYLITSPDSSKRLAWDICGMLLLLYDIIMIPIGAFQSRATAFHRIMDWVTLLFWSGDMFASLITGFVERGETIMKPGRIAINYFSKWFWLDVLVVGPDWCFTLLDLFVEDGVDSSGGGGAGDAAGLLRVFRAVRVLRLLRLAKLKRLFQRLMDLITSEVVFLAVFVIKLLTVLLFSNHFLASLWYLIGDVVRDGGDNKNWISSEGIEGRSLFYRYSTAYQWSMSNFALGATSVFPKNDVERAFAIYVLVFGMLMFSLMTASITASMVRLQSMSSDKATQFWLLRRYLRQHEVSNGLSFRLLRFLEYKVSVTKEAVSEDRLTLLGSLSGSLNRELKCSVNFGPLLQCHPLFLRALQISQSTVHSLADGALDLQSYFDHDVIFSRGNVAHEMYWITEGILSYNRGGEDRQKISAKSGDWFCESALWTYWPCRGKLVVVDRTCQMIRLDAQSFLELMQADPILCSMMSFYGTDYVEKLNEIEKDQLSDLSRGDRAPAEVFERLEIVKDTMKKQLKTQRKSISSSLSSLPSIPDNDKQLESFPLRR